MTDVRPGAFTLSLIMLDRDAPTPLYRQLYSSIRTAVLQQKLPPGTRLPATRELAQRLDVSRNTIVNAFEQLLAEGYLETRVGAGTYINSHLPEEYLQVEEPDTAAADGEGPRTISQRGRAVARHGQATAPPLPPPVFPLNQPDLEAFPLALWARLAARRYRTMGAAALGYRVHPAGYPPLRQAIADHLWTARGVRCTPEQIVLVAGSQQGVYLAGQVLLDSGDTIWVEEPGYGGAQAALRSGGAQLAPVAVDEEGLIVAAGQETAPAARAAYITPSHQFPLGMMMSLGRRLELLQWAAAGDCWIIEDDYDSDFRYGGAPLAALQGLDRRRRVIYVGTFSKTVFPQLRLGYVVAPEDLVTAFIAARSSVSLMPPLLPQMVLADFIREGHFQRHLRRMRRRYQARRDALLTALAEAPAGLLTPGPADTGIHLTVWLPPDADDRAIFRRAWEQQIMAVPLSWMYEGTPARPGLILGFASATPAQLREGVARLAAVVAAG